MTDQTKEFNSTVTCYLYILTNTKFLLAKTKYVIPAHTVDDFIIVVFDVVVVVDNMVGVGVGENMVVVVVYSIGVFAFIIIYFCVCLHYDNIE